MKKKALAKRLCAVTAIVCASIFLASCSIGRWRINPDDYKLPIPTILTFVVAEGKNWDQEVSYGEANKDFGKRGFTISLKLIGDDEHTLELLGTHLAKDKAEEEDSEEPAEGGETAAVTGYGDLIVKLGGEPQSGGEESKGSGGEESKGSGDGQVPGGEGQNSGGEESKGSGDGQVPGGEGQNSGGEESKGSEEGQVPGGEGGDQPGGQQGGDSKGGKGGGEVEQDSVPDTEDIYFNFNGYWEEEEGYGYKIIINDDGDNNVKTGSTYYTNYDKTTGRHYFSASIAPTIKGIACAAQKVKLQAKDSEYRTKLAKDYKIHEEREATYVFKGSTGSSMTALYLEKDNTVMTSTDGGSTISLQQGATWSEGGNVITVLIGNTTYTSEYCAKEGKKGYRINYNGTICYASATEGVEWSAFTYEDFDGANKIMTHAADSSVGNYYLNITEKNIAVILEGSNTLYVYNCVYNAANDSYSFVGENNVTYTIEGVAGVYSGTVKFSVQGSKNTEEKTVLFTSANNG